MLIRNRYLRNNRHAAKLSLELRKYYYTGCIGLALVACLGLASLRYITYDSNAAGATPRRVLADIDIDPPLAQRRWLASADAKEDKCPELNDGNELSVRQCEDFRCALDNFCEFKGPAPTNEYERDFLFLLQGKSRTKIECEDIQAIDFKNQVKGSDLGDFALHDYDDTHLKYAAKHLWCAWDEVLGRCVHSGRFCYMLRSEYLCKKYCPAFDWHNLKVVAEDSSVFKHIFSDPDQVVEDLNASSIPGVCNGTGDPFVEVKHINHECVHGPSGGWKDFPPWLSGRPEGADFNLREPLGSFIGSLIWIILVLYGFVGIAIVCDEFFEPSLGLISEKLGLSDDVAGATFMAIGSSAPELFSSFVDVFIVQNNVGIGTIVGSAMFNILIIVGVSALFATVGSHEKKTSLKVDWRPIVRDVSFYTFSIILIVAFFWDSRVMWYEGLSLCLAYVIYIIVMVYNEKLMEIIPKEICPSRETKVITEADMTAIVPVSEKAKKDGTDSMDNGHKMELKVAKQDNGDAAKADGEAGENYKKADLESADGDDAAKADSEPTGDSDAATADGEAQVDGAPANDDIWDLPTGSGAKCCVGWFWFILKVPWLALFTITIPHPSPQKCEKLYVLTFIMCIIWMGGLCFIEVILVSFLGCTWNIDPTVLGITFLAIGTSVPDAIASIIVARAGQGDMAVANAVGSNVFDILLGLGLPWFLGDLVFRATGGTIGLCGLPEGIFVNRDGILVSTFILLATVAVYAFVLGLCRCRLNPGVAFGLFVWYFLYLAITISSEVCVGGFSWKMNNHNCDPYGGSLFQ